MVSGSETSTEIPAIDLGDMLNLDDFRQASEENKQYLGQAIVEAFHGVGFAFVRAPRDYVPKLDAMYDEGAKLFALNEETKMQYDGALHNFQRGYTPLLREQALFCKRVLVEGEDERRPIANYAENWFIGPEGLENSPLAAVYPDDYIANVWPAEVPGLKEATLPVYDATRVMGDLVMAAAEAQLRLPDGYFAGKTADSPTLLRQLHYPPALEQGIADGSIRGACQHTDINYWTTLPKAKNLLPNAGGGLEVRTKDGQWIPGKAPEGYFIMQVGDMLQRESGGYFLSAQHRVNSPILRGEMSLGRLSCAMFTHPASNVDLKVFDLSHLTDHQKSYPDLNAHDYLMRRLQQIDLAD